MSFRRVTVLFAALLLLTLTDRQAESADAAPAEPPGYIGLFFHPGFSSQEAQDLGQELDPTTFAGNSLPGTSVVWGVFPGSPADKAGIRAGDRILEIDDSPVHTQAKIGQLLEGHRVGDVVRLKLQRSPDKPLEKSITLGPIPPDLNRRLFQLANDGAVWAQWGVALSYHDGTGTERDLDKARYWLEQVASRGLAHAAWFLGQTFEASGDLQKADKWYAKSAKENYPPALHATAKFYLLGQVVPPDKTLAVMLFRASAEQGYSPAKRDLAMLLLTGKAVPRDVKAGFELLTEAANDGHLESQAQLAALYFDGITGKPDYSASHRWCLAPAKAGLPLAQTILGMQLHYGLGLDRDDGEAARLLHLAATSGFAKAQSTLGELYRLASPPDYTKARDWLTKAAHQGDRESLYHLGLMAQFGQGGQADDRAAFDFYHRAARMGHPASETAVGVYCCRGGPVSRNFPIAMKWFVRGAEHGDSIAAYNAGVLYAKGQGVEKDEVKAHQWFALAARKGNSPALYRLGTEALRKKDYANAVKHIRPAAERGYAPAQLTLATLYQNGWGVKASREEAIMWNLRAARQGDAAATQALEVLGITLEGAKSPSDHTIQVTR